MRMTLPSKAMGYVRRTPARYRIGSATLAPTPTAHYPPSNNGSPDQRRYALSRNAGHAPLVIRESSPISPRPPKLPDRVREANRLRHGSRSTEKSYVGWIRRYILFDGKRHPAEMGAPEVTRFLSLLFLYRHVLHQDLPWLDDVVRAKRPERLPIVLTRDEVRAVIFELDGTPRLMATLLYGSGLRLLECARLRVQDIDFATNQIIVRDGKGAKDRVTVLPAVAKATLARHLQRVKRQHEADLAHGGAKDY